MHIKYYLRIILSALALLLSACNDGGHSSAATLESSSSGNGAWELVWSDEFDGHSLDSEKWAREINCWGGGNRELQCYTSEATNSYVNNGSLYLVARKESYRGSPLPETDPNYRADDMSAARNYTSARLSTRYKGDWRYGRIEVNARMPQGQGLWPAIWMLPTDSVYGPWPLSGEIDIFEAINLNASHGNEMHGTLHFGSLMPANKQSGSSYLPVKNIWEYAHTYAIEWEEGEIRWYVDDIHFATQTQAGWFTHYRKGKDQHLTTGEGAAPFDQPFHLLLNLAVGGRWPEPPDVDTALPQYMEIDYVRIYQCTADRVTGRGCATVNEDVQPLAGIAGPG
jgi:beta-glucanase (GH16 family)